MPYLIQNDFVKQIQRVNLLQVVGSDYSIVNSWLLAAEEKAGSYLKQKYDIAQEFTNTAIWNGSLVYNAANRVYLDAPAYSALATYAVGNYCTYQNNFYIATAISTAIAFDPAKWSAPIPQYTLYFAAFPFLPFDVYGNYNVGDKVFWKNKVYTANQPTADTNNSYVLQYGTYNNIPLNNYFPDAPHQTQWITPTTYTLPANTPITNTTYWTQGDNRSQEMVMTLVNLVLYYAHFRISPMNIPEHIGKNYRDAIQWFKDAAGVGNSNVTPNLVKIQPNKGARIRFGGSIRQQNGYVITFFLLLQLLHKL